MAASIRLEALRGILSFIVGLRRAGLSGRFAAFQPLPLLPVRHQFAGLPVACGAVGIAGGALRVVVPVTLLSILPGARGALSERALDGRLIVAGDTHTHGNH